jgi:hypothetical protein
MIAFSHGPILTYRVSQQKKRVQENLPQHGWSFGRRLESCLEDEAWSSLKSEKRPPFHKQLSADQMSTVGTSKQCSFTVSHCQPAVTEYSDSDPRADRWLLQWTDGGFGWSGRNGCLKGGVKRRATSCLGGESVFCVSLCML